MFRRKAVRRADPRRWARNALSQALFGPADAPPEAGAQDDLAVTALTSTPPCYELGAPTASPVDSFDLPGLRADRS